MQRDDHERDGAAGVMRPNEGTERVRQRVPTARRFSVKPTNLSYSNPARPAISLACVFCLCTSHTEATVQLCQAAGLPPVGVCCEVMGPDGRMAGPAELERFALHWGLPLVDIHELAVWL